MPHDCRTVRHLRRPGRPSAADRESHHCVAAGREVIECPPHRCKPMSASAILQMHWIISSTLAAAVRWGWIASNPANTARKPRRQPPQPEPPSPQDAARIIEAAWAQDDSWGTLVWLVMVTGIRRAELAGLRWKHVDLEAATVRVSRNWVRWRLTRPGRWPSIPPRWTSSSSTASSISIGCASSRSSLRPRRSCSPRGPSTTGPTHQAESPAATRTGAPTSGSTVM
jgi:hypothetical protein